MLGGVMDIGHAILVALGYLAAVLFFSLLGGAGCHFAKSVTTKRGRGADRPFERSAPSGSIPDAAGVATEEYEIF
jgi:hypothetical protein